MSRRLLTKSRKSHARLCGDIFKSNLDETLLRTLSNPASGSWLLVQVTGGPACEAGVSIEPGVERGFASETPGMRSEIYCPLKAASKPLKHAPESSIALPRPISEIYFVSTEAQT